MESKICTYTEKGVRLQLVRVNDRIELRFNRKVIHEWPNGVLYSKEARLFFLSACHQILILRSSSLSYLT